MKKLLLFACCCAVINIAANAQSGIYESYTILSINGSANKYYDMNAATGNTDFNGNNLGNFFPGSTLVVKGGQNKTFKCGGCDITNGFLQYRVYLTSGGPSGAFTGLSMNFLSNDAGGCGGNQTWQGTGGTTNIIGGLSTPGNYTLEVYTTADYQFCGNGTNYSNNGGANYKATFNYCNSKTLHTATSLDCENSVIPDYGNTFMNNCGIIAKVVPQGASPVSGTVNACVYTYSKAERHPGAYTVYAPRVYEIKPASNAATATARITLYYSQADLDAYDTELGYDAMPNSGSDPDLTNKKVYMVFTKYSNNVSFGSFSDPGELINPDDADIVWNSADNWWEISFDNAGFSEFYLHTGVSILNDKKVMITGNSKGTYNQINWLLPCGSDIKTVSLQKQNAGGIFETLRSFTGSAITCGNVATEKDFAIGNGAQYYRILLTSASGEQSFSDILKTENQLTLTGTAMIHPNPVTNRLTLRWNALHTGRLTVQVKDISGRVIKSVGFSQVNGVQQQVVDVHDLHPGIYLLTLNTPTGRTTETLRFIKQ